MSFHINPLFPGDIYESAQRLGSDIVAATLGKDDLLPVLHEGWETARSLGWTTFMVPEALGGVGAGYKELAEIMEGIGHSGCSLPVASQCFAVPEALAASDQPLARTLLSGLADDSQSIAIAAVRPADLVVVPEGGGFRLDGEVHAVESGTAPCTVLLHCRGAGDEPLLLAVPTSLPGVSMRHHVRMDGRAVTDLAFQGVSIGGEHLLLQGDRAAQVSERAEAYGILLMAVECVAAMGRMLADTIEYLKNRQQFGSVLSSFQVLRHAVADLYVDYEGIKAQTQALLDQTTDTDIDPRRCSLLMISLAQLGRRFGEQVIQLHGGMGMTEELLAARQAKRLIYAGFEHGGERRHLTLAGEATFLVEQAA